jgi:hypothetical protein
LHGKADVVCRYPLSSHYYVSGCRADRRISNNLVGTPRTRASRHTVKRHRAWCIRKAIAIDLDRRRYCSSIGGKTSYVGIDCKIVGIAWRRRSASLCRTHKHSARGGWVRNRNYDCGVAPACRGRSGCSRETDVASDALRGSEVRASYGHRCSGYGWIGRHASDDRNDCE